MNTYANTSGDRNRLSSGIVYQKQTGSYQVHLGEQTLFCTLAARLRLDSPVAVGDFVEVAETQPGAGQIVAVLPRRSQLSRRAAMPHAGGHAFEQVIVANVDQVVTVFAAAEPPPHWNLLDRYLASAEQAGLPTLICLTKIDLVQDADRRLTTALDGALDDYRRIGYPVVLTSTHSGEGLDGLQQCLQGKTSVLIGKSGVGKTSLLNALQPGLGQRVGQASRGTGKGRHTTSSLAMFPLEAGGAIVDTPGMREFGLWDLDPDDLAGAFPEMRPYIGQCRFRLDCQHLEEPGCAVRKAVMAGMISPRRYQSYTRLREEMP